MKNFEAWFGSLEWWELYFGIAIVATICVLGKEMIYPYKKSNGRGR
jgi:hypothetical protein